MIMHDIAACAWDCIGQTLQSEFHICISPDDCFKTADAATCNCYILCLIKKLWAVHLRLLPFESRLGYSGVMTILSLAAC